jgi:hypothetical protein
MAAAENNEDFGDVDNMLDNLETMMNTPANKKVDEDEDVHALQRHTINI